MNNEKYFDLLDTLHKSGSVSMFYAPTCLHELCGLSKKESYEIVVAWNDTFKEAA